MISKQDLGQKAEELAEKFLKRKGYEILKRNYRTRIGEVDIVAEDEGTLVFVEVRCRSYTDFGEPQVSVGRVKQRQVSKAALRYLQEHKAFDRSSRFDVIAISFPSSQNPKIDHIENAFELDSRYTF